MRRLMFLPVLLASASLSLAEMVPFTLGPDGLMPITPSVEGETAGSGDVIPPGIWFNTEDLTLSFSIGYGSSMGFTDLSGVVTMAQIRGPLEDGTDGELFDLQPQNFSNSSPELGGILWGTVVYTEAQAAALLAGEHYVVLGTEANPEGELSAFLMPPINETPIVICPDPATQECEGPEGAEVVVIVMVADAEGDPLRVTYTVDGGESQMVEVPATDPGMETPVELSALLGLGEHMFDVEVSDGETSSMCGTTVTVVDTLPPDIQRIRPNPSILWPPNHKMVPVRLRVKVEDCSPVTTRIVKVSSNEPDNGTGDGNTDGDWEITGDLTLNLRAERSGKGSSRIYTIKIESEDEHGNVSMARTRVMVPHDRGGWRR